MLGKLHVGPGQAGYFDAPQPGQHHQEQDRRHRRVGGGDGRRVGVMGRARQPVRQLGPLDQFDRVGTAETLAARPPVERREVRQCGVTGRWANSTPVYERLHVVAGGPAPVAARGERTYERHPPPGRFGDQATPAHRRRPRRPGSNPGHRRPWVSRAAAIAAARSSSSSWTSSTRPLRHGPNEEVRGRRASHEHLVILPNPSGGRRIILTAWSKGSAPGVHHGSLGYVTWRPKRYRGQTAYTCP